MPLEIISHYSCVLYHRCCKRIIINLSISFYDVAFTNTNRILLQRWKQKIIKSSSKMITSERWIKNRKWENESNDKNLNFLSMDRKGNSQLNEVKN